MERGQGLRLRLPRFRVLGSGFRVIQGLGFRVEGLGLILHASGFGAEIIS